MPGWSLSLFPARRAGSETSGQELEARSRARATVTRRLCTIAGCYTYAAEEELPGDSPAAHVRPPGWTASCTAGQQVPGPEDHPPVPGRAGTTDGQLVILALGAGHRREAYQAHVLMSGRDPGRARLPRYRGQVAITNWAGNVTFTAADVLRPRSSGELRALVARTPRLRVLGARHSFSPVADSPALVTLDGLPTEVEIDSARATARVSAGIRYAELARGLDVRGFALANLASLPHITVAGAVATGTHGSGSRNGALPTSVAGIEMVTADGDLVTIGPDELSGAVVTLGALGVVTGLVLTLVPSFTVRQWVYDNMPRAELDARFGEIFASAYSVSVFTTWQDPGNLDQVWVKHRADDGWTAPDCWHGARLAAGQRHPVPGMPPGYTTPQGGAEGRWHERLPHFRADFTPSAGDELQTEYLLPRDQAIAALAALDGLASQIAPALLVCELRTIAADDRWLSPCYGRESAGIHFTWRKDPAAVAALLPDIEERLAPFGPRPHWGKIFALPPARIRASYPRLEEFGQLMTAYDPDGKFRNSFIDDIIGTSRGANA